MKYAQLLIGLLIGTALGGSVVASTGAPIFGGASATAMDAEAVKQIVRETISQEPKLILDSVQKFQQDEMKKSQQSANEMLKDREIQKALYENPDSAVAGNKEAKRTVVEFFDYNCGVCKMMFKSIDELLKKDKNVRVIFHEYPIFGPVSDTNTKLGFAVWRLYPEKYYDFHTKVMTHEGRVDEKTVLEIAGALGMNTTKIKAESDKKEVADLLTASRELGGKLHVQGTPTLVIGDEIIPHAIDLNEVESRLGATESSTKGSAAPTEKPAEAKPSEASPKKAIAKPAVDGAKNEESGSSEEE